jgi:hypothetical protein
MVQQAHQTRHYGTVAVSACSREMGDMQPSIRAQGSYLIRSIRLEHDWQHDDPRLRGIAMPLLRRIRMAIH